MDSQDAFNAFYEEIELPALSQERMGSAWARLHAHLTKEYGLSDQDVFIQGSWANNTAIKPAGTDAEYDIDIVAVCCDATCDARKAIDELRQVLARNGDLEARIEPDEQGRPCVRLRYADDPDRTGFHVDVVPSRPVAASSPPLEVPVRGQEGWRGTDPLAYTAWCLRQGEPFRRAVRMLKSWRDHRDVPIKSILLQVLVGYDFPGSAGTDAELIEVTLSNIRSRLSGNLNSAPVVRNPVLETENLADRWSDEDYRRFRGLLNEVIDDVRAAREATSESESRKIWRQVFGNAFPASPTDGQTVVVPPPPLTPPRKPNPDRGRRYG